MSEISTQTQAPMTVHLSNGQTCSFTSNISVELDEIPIIDISAIHSDKLEDRQALAEKIRDASHRIGFFYITNHVSLRKTYGFFASF